MLSAKMLRTQIRPIMLIIPEIRHNKTDTAKAMSVKNTLLTSFFAEQVEGAKVFASLDELLDCANLVNIILPSKKYYFIYNSTIHTICQPNIHFCRKNIQKTQTNLAYLKGLIYAMSIYNSSSVTMNTIDHPCPSNK